MIQFHARLPEDAKAVTISFRVHGFTPKLLVKFGPDPITFDYKPFAVGDVKTLDPRQDGMALTAKVDVPAGQKEVYFMVANGSDDTGLYGKIVVAPESAAEPGDGPSTDDASCAASAAPSRTRGAGLALAMAAAGIALSRRRRARRAR